MDMVAALCTVYNDGGRATVQWITSSRFPVSSPSLPVPRFARSVRNSDDDNPVQVRSVDHLERKTTEQEKPVSVVAEWEPLGPRCNRLQGSLKFGFELLGGVDASFHVPAECVGIVRLRCGRYKNVNHQCPPGVGIEYGHPTKMKPTCARRRFLRNVAETQQPKLRSDSPTRPVKACPTKRRSVALFPRWGDFVRLPGFLEGRPYFKSNTVRPASQL